MAGASDFSRRPPAIAAIRASVLVPLVQELDKKHGKTDVLLACHGILRSQLDDPYAFVPLARYVAIFEEAAEILREPTLGARLGISFKPADIGPLGILFSASSTIRSAFQRLSKHVVALQGVTRAGLIEEGDYLLWSYKLEDPRLWPRHQDTEYSLAASCQLVRSSFSASWRPVEIHFEHAAPRDREPLQRIFRAPLLFSQSSNRIVMLKTDADRHYRNEDRDLTAILERHIGDLSSGNVDQDSVRDQVLSVIAIYLGHKPITIAAVAAELKLSVRTLQRRLSDENTSVRALVREYRAGIAQLYLRAGTSGYSRLADTLGYADSTVFWRAFKDWTGLSPSTVAAEDERMRSS
ncbi:AraC family transcriptional regulator [Agrobacterium rhizogenes]|uniref:AraC family transcriptional regulator n=1 Tax=Rhizobium rhizogenes TaxID=359 RepID=UPI001572368A|nr:AraC family transcriptional regulator [Rhizobium rhizogenes]NTI65787.1 AraC family transcriptional regulator [Rhizobium rhizogenes]